MKNIYKIEEELVDILNFIHLDSTINLNSKNIIYNKLKKVIFDVKVLKEILDENECFSSLSYKHKLSLSKINNKNSVNISQNNLNNDKIINELFEKYNDNLIPITNYNKFNDLEEEENIERIYLIPKNSSNQSLLSLDLNK
jgi:hypothetical protein